MGERIPSRETTTWKEVSHEDGTVESRQRWEGGGVRGRTEEGAPGEGGLGFG